ncbi:hypothetical protein RCL1_007841 [Eukaryota sp. TZLM3-RCL]
MTTFAHTLKDCLGLALKQELLTNFEILFLGHHLSCHRSVVSSFFHRINGSIEQYLDTYDVGEVDFASFEDLQLLVLSLYAEPISVTNTNALGFLFLSKSLACSELEKVCVDVLRTFTATTFGPSIESILNNLRSDEFNDHEIIFHDFSLKIHKFLFVSISPYFKAKFAKQWLHSNDTTSDFSKLLEVSALSCSNFFNSFYDGKLEVNFENAFEYSHLAWYFQLAELEKFVEDFILNSKAEYQWVTSLVMKAINCEDYRFIKIISTKISKDRTYQIAILFQFMLYFFKI